MNKNDINIFEDGQQSRDFVYIDDVIDATILSIQKTVPQNIALNVGSGVATTVEEVAQNLKQLYQSDINIRISGEYRLGDIRHNKADINKISKLLGFQPKTSFKEGVSLFVEWVKKQEIQSDNYEQSILELKEKGLMK